MLAPPLTPTALHAKPNNKRSTKRDLPEDRGATLGLHPSRRSRTTPKPAGDQRPAQQHPSTNLAGRRTAPVLSWGGSHVQVPPSAFVLKDRDSSPPVAGRPTRVRSGWWRHRHGRSHGGCAVLARYRAGHRAGAAGGQGHRPPSPTSRTSRQI